MLAFGVAMPKTPMNEDREPPTREHKIGIPRQIFPMEPKT